MRRVAALALVMAGAALAGPVAAQDAAQDEILAEAIRDYMDFATYEAGIILPAQIDGSVFAAATFIDTRNADQYAAGHIAGAANIEWREVPGRLDELPESGPVILYCNTGSLSAQAVFAARLLGRENVLLMQGGINEWRQSAAYRP